ESAPANSGLPRDDGASCLASIAVANAGDVIRVRQAAREMSRTVGFAVVDQTRLVTAISEAARHMLAVAGGCQCDVVARRAGQTAVVEVGMVNVGPVTSGLEAASRPDRGAGESLGGGLPGVRRLVDEFLVEPEAEGTRVSFRFSRSV
ncbi:MAG: hypothetical protein ABT940_12530, partial [Alphaproteobacteria bacterium]